MPLKCSSNYGRHPKVIEDLDFSNNGIKRKIIVGKYEKVCEILLMPICCDKKQDRVLRVDNIIQSGQKYYSIADEDMSDFAVGFYEIVYRDVLKSKSILGINGRLSNTEFAGDTMNSFNRIANATPLAGKSYKTRTAKEKWPEYLRNYHNRRFH